MTATQEGSAVGGSRMRLGYPVRSRSARAIRHQLVSPGHSATRLPLHFYKSSNIVASCRSRRGDAQGCFCFLPGRCSLLAVPSPAHHPPLSSIDLPQGTLDLLILKALSLQPMHGWAISERLHQVSRATLQVPQGSLYPALHRLERRGLIRAEWGASDNNRKAKYYELTRAGRRQLAAETDAWEKLTTAVALVLEQA